MSSLTDHLKCPICFEIPEGKVYQCKNGHTFCCNCNKQLKACPQCRVHLGSERIRNRTLEQILDITKFSCPNKEVGCSKVLGRGEISSHLLYCKFEPFYFCKLIGFQSCSYNAVSSLLGNSNDLLLHLKTAHPEIQETELGKDNYVQLSYENFLCRANHLERGSVAIWTPHLVKVIMGNEDEAEQGTLLLFLCQISEVTRNAAWICLCMTTDIPTAITQDASDLLSTTVAADPHQNESVIDVSCSRKTSSGNKNKIATIITYQIKGQRNDYPRINLGHDQNGLDDDNCKSALLTPEMTWKAPVLTFKDIEKELESYALRIPLCVLNSFQGAQGSLEIGVSLKNERVQFTPSLHCPIIPELTSFITSAIHLPRKPQCPTYCISNDQVNDLDDDDEDQNQVIFANVFCNGCGQRPMVNVRYKCLQCVDYDLCRVCMDRGDTHRHHVFARIHDTRQNELFNWKHRMRMLKGRRSSYI